MKPNASHITIDFTIKIITITLLLSSLPSLISSQTCSKTCGKIPIKYPFGTGQGCGDPRFNPYITCNDQQQQLTLSTHTGCYTVTSVDYISQVIYVSDPTMSTCDCTQPSKGFGLDWNAPFSFSEDTLFALLGCSSTSTSYNLADVSGNNSSLPLCDSKGASVCSLLYSCETMSRLTLPISSCCVYGPVDLGPSFEMDLEKLHCTSYLALYGYNGGDEEYLNVNAEGWRYGIGLKYKFSYNNEYPENCASCEKTDGVCGYDVMSSDASFVCNCPGGFNRTTDCFYGRPWSYGSRILPPWNAGVSIIVFSLAWFIKLTFV